MLFLLMGVFTYVCVYTRGIVNGNLERCYKSASAAAHSESYF